MAYRTEQAAARRVDQAHAEPRRQGHHHRQSAEERQPGPADPHRRRTRRQEPADLRAVEGDVDAHARNRSHDRGGVRARRVGDALLTGRPRRARRQRRRRCAWLRRVATDGGRLPSDPDLLWMGTSVGKWVDDRNFQVETVGFNQKTWLDRLGHAHSDQLKVTENFRRLDRDHLELDIKMEDPKALAKPWVTTFYYANRPNWELGEISCSGDYLDSTAFETGWKDSRT